MSCFDNLIGIDKICTPDTPTSGKFLNTLNGVNIKNMSAGIGEEDLSAVSSLKTLIDEGINYIKQEIRVALMPKMRFDSIVENRYAGFYQENLQAIALEAGKYKGIEVLIEGKHLAFNLEQITLILNATVNTSVFVFDLISGQLLDTIAIATVADTPVTIYPNKSYTTNGQRRRLLIAVDSSVAGTYKTTLYSAGGCSSCGSKWWSPNRYASFQAVEILQGASKIANNTTNITHTNGISIGYSVSCDSGNFICNMATLFADPLRYKTAELMFEKLQVPSSRLNTIVTVQSKEVEFFRQMYEGKYNESMRSILSNLSVPDDECFHCTPAVKLKLAIP